MNINISANETMYSIEEINHILLRSGMSQVELNEMDDETKQFIIENSGTDLEYVPLSATPQITRAGTAPVSITCPSFKVMANGEYVYDIYPIYESIGKIEPKGNDSFAFTVGDGLGVVNDHVGGMVYYREESDDAWQSMELSVSNTSLYGHSFYGPQLGTPDFPIYIKANCFFRAKAYSSEPDLRVNVKYVHDTSGSVGYTIGLTAYGVNVSLASESQTGSLLERSENFDVDDTY